MVPVAIGGVGGSGTRVIADMLRRLGIFIGSDLNGALDNLWFTLLFKEPEVMRRSQPEIERRFQILMSAMSGEPVSGFEEDWIAALTTHDRPQHPASWLKERAATLTSALREPVANRCWGWKEPNTHIVVPVLQQICPALKYVHVMRNGLDMAFSSNQNQLALWGSQFLGRPVKIGPVDSLAFWARAQQRILLWAGNLPADACLFLKFEDVCSDPVAAFEKLAAFLGRSADSNHKDALMDEVRPPATIGRFKLAANTGFSPDDIKYLARLGYDTQFD